MTLWMFGMTAHLPVTRTPHRHPHTSSSPAHLIITGTPHHHPAHLFVTPGLTRGPEAGRRGAVRPAYDQ